MKILLLDNNGRLAVNMVSELNRAGHDTSEVGNLDAAISLCRKDDFDFVIVTDYRPPAVTVSKLLETKASLRFIIVAESPDWKDAAGAVGNSSVTAYVPSPPDMAEIFNLIEENGSGAGRKRVAGDGDVVSLSNLPYINERLKHEMAKHEKMRRTAQDSENNLNTVLDSAHIGTWDCDIATGHVINNRCWAEMFGYTLEEIEPNLDFWLDRVHTDDLPQILDHMRKDMESDAGIFEKEYRIKTRSGDWKWVMARGRVIERSPDGKPLRHTGICVDITDRKAMESSLHDSEQRLQTIISNMPVMLDAFDENMRLVAWNCECERITGYSAEEMIGNSNIMEFLYPDPEYREQLVGAWSDLNGDFINWEADITCKDGTKKTISWTNMSNKFPIDGWSTWAIGFDVSEQKRLEKELGETKEQLIGLRKTETVGTLTGSTALEFNNLLAVIMGSASLAMSKIAKSNMLYDDLKNISESCIKAGKLVEQLLSITDGRSSGKYRIGVRELLKRSIADFRKKCPPGIKIEFNAKEDLDQVRVDPEQLSLAFGNILMNSVEAMPDGGTIRIDVAPASPESRFAFERPGHDPSAFCEISISDSGIGIPKHIITKVSEPFFTSWKQGKGSGLGLPVAIGIVEKHGGALLVESKRQAGTIVHVCLPFAGAKTSADDRINISRGSETILVVDDHESARAITGSVLARAGYKILLATDRENAIEIYSRTKNEIAACVLDVKSPDEYSMEILPRLIALNPDVRILITTEYDSSQPWKEMDGLGLYHILEKPFSYPDLCSRLRLLLDE